MKHVIKRRGHKEEFDDRKVYAAVYAACLTVKVQHEEAENIAGEVSDAVKKWVHEHEHSEISSSHIFHKTGEELKRLNKDAAFMFLTHRDIS
jgi:transcriptional regulator NrdR family protein